METSQMKSSCDECFQALGCFDYNAANKIIKRVSPTNQGIGGVFITLSKCEQTYTSFEFLKSKFFRKEDFLGTLYSEATKEIQSVVRTLKISQNGTDQVDIDYFVDLCKSLHEFMSIRQDQIVIYKDIIPSVFPDLLDKGIIEDMKSITARVETSGMKEKMGLLGFGIERELTILRNLLIAHKAIINYNFKDTTIYLYTAKVALSEWRSTRSQQEYSEKSANKSEETSRSLSAWFFSGSSEKQSKGGRRVDFFPSNMQWLTKFLSHLTAKMTLYFMNVLLEREKVLGGDVKSLWRKIDIDYHGLMRSFRKRSGAHSIALIYEVTDDVKFYSQGYVCDGLPYEKLTGLNSFPCIYCCPKEPQPTDHWPNIISIMQNCDEPIKSTPFHRTTPIHFCDKRAGSTYYVIRIDSHVGLVVIYSDKHASPDVATCDFMMQIAKRLSGVEILHSLPKTGD